MKQIHVVLDPSPEGVRLLMWGHERDRLKARLSPLSLAHPQAARTLLEGLALWENNRLGVVVCAGDRSDGLARDLYEALASHKLHFDVGIAYHARRQRPGSRGLGRFDDLRGLEIVEVAS